MILYSQRDPRWAAHPLGWGPALGTIGQFGCLDTVDAMIATDSGHVLNPVQIDEAFTAAQIFMRDPTGTFDLLPDNALARAFPGRYAVSSYAGFRGDLIKAAVPSPDTYAVLWISTSSVPTHFVLASSADGSSIIDPWTGSYGRLSGYGGPAAVHKTVLVKVLAPAPPLPPSPVPVPTPPPAPATTPPPHARQFLFTMRSSALLAPVTEASTFDEAYALAEQTCKENPGSSSTLETTIGSEN